MPFLMVMEMDLLPGRGNRRNFRRAVFNQPNDGDHNSDVKHVDRERRSAYKWSLGF